MRVIANTEAKGLRTVMLIERDRLSLELDAKRLERFELERQKRQNNSDADADTINGRIDKVLSEIESLQIKFMGIYRQTWCHVGGVCEWIYGGASGQVMTSKASHIPDLPSQGNVVLRHLTAYWLRAKR